MTTPARRIRATIPTLHGAPKARPHGETDDTAMLNLARQMADCVVRREPIEPYLQALVSIRREELRPETHRFQKELLAAARQIADRTIAGATIAEHLSALVQARRMEIGSGADSLPPSLRPSVSA